MKRSTPTLDDGPTPTLNICDDALVNVTYHLHPSSWMAFLQTSRQFHRCGTSYASAIDPSCNDNAAVHWACSQEKNVCIATLLKDRRVDWYHSDYWDFCPFGRVVYYGNYSACKLLFDGGIDQNRVDSANENVLFDCIRNDGFGRLNCRYDICKLLLERKADVTCVNDEGRTPLAYARNTNLEPDLIALLKEFGAAE